MAGAVQVTVAGATRRDQRVQASREDMAMARELVSSAAWPWFVAKCEAKAAVLEKRLTSVTDDMNQRQEDRFRGMADSYRRMPGLINEVAAEYDRVQDIIKKQQQKEQQQ